MGRVSWKPPLEEASSLPSTPCSRAFPPPDPHEDDASCHVQTADGPGAARLHLSVPGSPSRRLAWRTLLIVVVFLCCIRVSAETFSSRAQHLVLHRKRRICKDLFALCLSPVCFPPPPENQESFVCAPLRMDNSLHPSGICPGPSYRTFKGPKVAVTAPRGSSYPKRHRPLRRNSQGQCRRSLSSA